MELVVFSFIRLVNLNIKQHLFYLRYIQFNKTLLNHFLFMNGPMFNYYQLKIVYTVLELIFLIFTIFDNYHHLSKVHILHEQLESI